MGVMKTKLGIRAQLIIGIVVVTIAGFSFIGMSTLYVVEGKALHRKVKEAETTAKLIRAAAIYGASSRGDERTSRFIKNISVEAQVEDLIITDSEGNIFVGKDVLTPIKGELIYFHDGIKIKKIKGIGNNRDEDALSVMIGKGSRRPASVDIAFTLSLKDIDRDISTIRGFIFLYIILDSIIIIALGVYFLSRLIVNPIMRLESSASKISGGNLEERVEIVADNEIGRLGKSFNTMAERLEGEILRLERLNRTLLKTQEELLRSSTLASVGSLAAGIAHEIGNPLGAVCGYLDFLIKSAEEARRCAENAIKSSKNALKNSENALVFGAEEEDVLRRMDKEIARINTILKEFLELSRPVSGPPGHVDVGELLKETVLTLSQHAGFSSEKVRLVLKEKLPPVIIDEGKLRQVFMNFFLNAAEAIRITGGELVVETKACETTNPDDLAPLGRRIGDTVFETSDKEYEPQVFVEIIFKDSGCGIKDETLKKIFDPFFTTKEPGEGTGLGLFISQSIIQTYGGSVEVWSKEGEGTTFKVTLPA